MPDTYSNPLSGPEFRPWTIPKTNIGHRRINTLSHRTTLPLLLLAFLGSVTPAIAQEETAEVIGAGVGLVIGLLIAIVIGAIVGWLAGLIVKGGGSGFWSNVLVGIGGSILANVLLPIIGISFGSVVGSFLAALIGAVILLLLFRLIRRAA